MILGDELDWPAALTHLSQRAVDGLERVEDGVYHRNLRSGPVRIGPGGDVRTDDPAVLERARRLLGMDADLRPIRERLSADPMLRDWIAARPLVRVMGGWDPFELACRAVLGQQVSIERARQLVGRLVARAGVRSATGALFPTPEEVLGTDLTDMGMPGARARTLHEIARAALADPELFTRVEPTEDRVARLRAIRGVGEWTAQYVTMRACRDPDAFPASDVGLLRGAAVDGARPTPQALLARAEAWRPYRAYAAAHLWAADAAKSP